MTEAVAAPAKRNKQIAQAEAQTTAATVPAASMPDRPKRESLPPALKPGDFEESQYAYLDVSAKMPAGMPFEAVYLPGFWGNVVHLFKKDVISGGSDRAGAIVHLRTEDHAFYAKLYVRAVLERGLIVQCIGPSIDPETGKACPIDLMTGMPWTGQRDAITTHLEPKWNGTKGGFDIVRKADLQIVADGSKFPTLEQALEWINKTAKAN